jgi:hypothetical protein
LGNFTIRVKIFNMKKLSVAIPHRKSYPPAVAEFDRSTDSSSKFHGKCHIHQPAPF